MLPGRRRQDEDEAVNLPEAGQDCLLLHCGVSGDKYRGRAISVKNQIDMLIFHKSYLYDFGYIVP